MILGLGGRHLLGSSAGTAAAFATPSCLFDSLGLGIGPLQGLHLCQLFLQLCQLLFELGFFSFSLGRFWLRLADFRRILFHSLLGLIGLFDFRAAGDLVLLPNAFCLTDLALKLWSYNPQTRSL